MKKILLFIVLTNSFAFSQKEYKKTLKDFNLSEGVSKIVEEDFNLILFSSPDGKPVEQHKLDERRVQLFNSDGVLLADSIIKGKKYYQKKYTLYSYNEDYLLKKIVQLKYNATLVETTNSYNTNKQLVKQIEDEWEYTLAYHDGKLINKSTIKYDFRGQSEKIHNADYKYNQVDSISSIVYQNFAFPRKEYSRFKYDKQLKNTTTLIYRDNKINDSIVKTSMYHNNGKLHEFNEKSYNSAGELSKEINRKFNDYGLEIFWELKYETTSDKNISEYDENQNLIIKEGVYNGKPAQKNIYTYKYDNNGNWLIKCEKIRDFKYLKQTKPEPIKVTKRLIHYNDSSISKKITKEEALCFCEPNYKKRLEKFTKKENSNTQPLIIKEVDMEEHK
ncbi:hypothetical protein I2486_15860 [Cellulophaga sp. E16_2]|uniref:hypothetical protein n=1 Tax=Cellulophaga sp. E16_2 TaxID=2789297 RepID=UPI001A918B17|nr:hypothetical protein [Cellulophaga sp. E16_2]MBO0592881.1 hypothetical protein [Cellulophaga sp. E16_2]